MEMEPGGPSLKKVKLAGVESREEAQATEAPGPDPTASARTTQPPPADDGDEAGVDRISSLPDPILGEIISLLRTKQGARTQILSTRWRHIWRSAPLNLDCRRLANDGHELDGVVAHIISTHPGPGRRFRIPAHYLQDRAAKVDAWLRSRTLDRLQELEFCHVWNYRPLDLPRLPPLALPPASAFRFSPTLRVLTIGRCLLRGSTIEELHLPQLKQLGLEWVSISEGTLRNLIARCPALECLLIYYIFGLRCARINSPGLISIGVRRPLRELGANAPFVERLLHAAQDKDELPLRELVIENAPCLERLLRVDILDGLLVSVISAPKLHTLGSLYGEMYLSSTILQRLPNDSLMTVVGTVKVLSVDIPCLDIRTTIELMRCFPFLEKLYIQQGHQGAS
ncbi:unnamed protein product [Alopecurus aequalis]